MTDPQNSTIAECVQARDDFYAYVREVYTGLYRIESRVNGGKSPLAVFCRIDIGLIEHPDTHKVFHLLPV